MLRVFPAFPVVCCTAPHPAPAPGDGDEAVWNGRRGPQGAWRATAQPSLAERLTRTGAETQRRATRNPDMWVRGGRRVTRPINPHPTWEKAPAAGDDCDARL